jgi:hypothetical protein
MKRYLYMEPDKKGNHVVVTMSEDFIIYNYWSCWKGHMEKKYGQDHKLITKQNCIADWIVLHWATEVR